MDPGQIAIVVGVALFVVVVLGVVLLRRTRRAAPPAAAPEERPAFPSAGLLVAEDVLGTDATTASLWAGLEAADVPIAVEYHPVSAAEVARLRTVAVGPAAQHAMAGVLRALDPKDPTLFRVVLPAGTELVKAVGSAGFRGFGRDATGISAHAVLKPVAAGGAIAAGWPVLAVAGAVFALDQAAQREQRAHQRRLESVLGRQEERAYAARITDQRSADDQLSRAISLLRDGRTPNLELAAKSAADEFYRALHFLERYRDVVDDLEDADGRVDLRRLEEALGGGSRDTDAFVRELHLSRAAIALRRKAVVADAAVAALADPDNAYPTFRRFLRSQVDELEQAAALSVAMTERLSTVELTGRWHETRRAVAERQERFRARISPARVDGGIDIRYLVTPSGQILQVLPLDDAAPV